MKRKILYCFILFLALVVGSFVWLKIGFSINSIHSDLINLEELYIKLDKKLILKAKNIQINPPNLSQNSPKDTAIMEIVELAKNINYLYSFVEEIDIENLSFAENEMRILFKNNEFFIDNDLLFLNLILSPNDKSLMVDIKSLFLKAYKLNLSGSLSINSHFKSYDFNGLANSNLASFKAMISYKEGELAYKFEDIKISSLNELVGILNERFGLDESLSLWLGKRVEAAFELTNLQGFANLNNKDFYFDDLALSGLAKNVSVRLDNNISAIKFDKINVSLNKQRLDLDFKKGEYNGASLAGSQVYLFDLFNQNAGIFLRINSANAIFDEKLRNSLRQFDLDLPFFQKEGKTKLDLKLKIGFNEHIKNTYDGVFELENASFSMANLLVKNALIRLKNESLSIENASVLNDFLNANFNASINLNTKNGFLDISSLALKHEFLNLQEHNLRAEVDYSKDFLLSIPAYQMSLNFTDGLRLELNDFSALASRFDMLNKLGITRAKRLFYSTKNYDDFSASVENLELSSLFKRNDGSVFEMDSFDINSQKNIIEIKSKSNLLNAVLTPNNKQISIKDLLYIHKSNEKEEFNAKTLKEYGNLSLEAENFGLVLEDFNKTLSFDKLNLSLENGNLSTKASKQNAKFDLFMNENDLRLDASLMNADFMDKFLQKNAFDEGEFNFYLSGSGLNNFAGSFEFKNTYIRDLRGINQLISFIDTVPSLLIFKAPDFNLKGLHLKNGRVLFTRQKDLLKFDAIELHGDNADVYGLGSANLRLNELDVNLELKTLKSASSVISNIPILNYVILGEDKEISTSLKVDGKIEEPKFHTQVLVDTLSTPFNLIKNIITLPKNLLK